MADRPRELADRLADRKRRPPADGFVRQTWTLPRDQARDQARAFLTAFPKAAYMSAVESWRELPGDQIEFTVRRLPSAD
jgi:hypothetical protein